MATYVDLDTIHRPSAGAIAPTEWGDQINDNFTALVAAMSENVVTQVPHSWTVSGLVEVPSGANSYLPPMIVPSPSGQTVTLAGVVLLCRAGNVTLSIEQDGTGITGLTGLTASTTKSALLTPTDTVTFSNLDELAPVVTAISDTPDGLTVTAFLNYSVDVTG